MKTPKPSAFPVRLALSNAYYFLNANYHNANTYAAPRRHAAAIRFVVGRTECLGIRPRAIPNKYANMVAAPPPRS